MEINGQHTTEHVSDKYKSFQEFLDNHQYSREGIESYEKIFGRYFVSVGGLETTKIFVSKLNLKPGQEVLDVGCGIGGSAFHMSEEYGAKVLGIDLSKNMINLAHDRLAECGVKNVSFQIADVMTIEFPENHFDVIYTRDTLLHIKNKKLVNQKLFSWLKPGGTLLITDYCCPEGEWTQEFTEYVKGRGYYITSLKEYVKKLEEAGFVNVTGENVNELFLKVHNADIPKIISLKDDYINSNLGEALHQYRLQGWYSKIERAKKGEQIWGFLMAKKPEAQ